MMAVSRRKDRLAHRPRDADRGVVPRHADLTLGIVNVRAFVLDLRDRADDAEPVGESGRHVALLEILRRQRHGHPAAEGRRSAPDIDRHVEDLAFDDAYQFALWTVELQMQTPERA